MVSELPSARRGIPPSASTPQRKLKRDDHELNREWQGSGAGQVGGASSCFAAETAAAASEGFDKGRFYFLVEACSEGHCDLPICRIT